MIIKEEKYCIIRKSFPLKFMQDGNECNSIKDVWLMSQDECEKELQTYDEPENYQIIKVEVAYEF